MFNSDSGVTMPVVPMGFGGNGFGNGFGDGFGAIIWLIVIAAIFGGGFGMFGNGWGNGFGWNNPGVQSALTRGELCQDMNFADLQNSVRGVQQSISDGFALQNMNFVDRVDNLANQIATGFDAVNLAIVRDGYETRNAAQQNMIANMQNTYMLNDSIKDCCCATQNGFSQVAYQQATDTCAIQNSLATAVRDITDNANANARSLYDFLVNDKISDLQQENQALRLAASQERQNNYLISELRPTARPAYITCNPYTASYGFNGGCGCGV